MRMLRWVCSGSCLVSAMLTGLVARADTHTAATAAYADVNAAVTAASAGDTVVVPAGTATWSSELQITKGIILKGAGAGNTVITGNISDHNNNGGGIIVYNPAAGTNQPFRVTGFTFDANNMSNGILLYGTTVPQTQVRIDHNAFSNAGDSNGSRNIYHYGDIYGVIDNNTFTGNGMPVGNRGNMAESWTLSRNFGDANNMYIEDNTITCTGTVMDGEHGGRYLCRYNTINCTIAPTPLFDMHGNQPGGLWGTTVAEIYGNDITAPAQNTADLVDQRGAQALVFFNKVTAGAVIGQIREEYADNVDGDNTHVQHVMNSYYWNNRWNGTTLKGTAIPVYATQMATGGGSNYILCNNSITSSFPERYGLYLIAGKGAGQMGDVSAFSPTQITINHNWSTIPDATTQYTVTADSQNVLHENQQFWNHQASFNGTVGMGAGTLANRPSTCTVGVGYWATTQDCTQTAAANIGAHPASPLSGTLYLCTATNTWTSYYTPYTYPNPLRTSGPLADDTTPPSAPPTVRDGTGSDIAYTTSTTQLSANWDASTDNESGISGYQYAIGTSAGGTQTVNWTSLGNVTTVTKTGLSLTNGQTYFFSVKAVNGVGLTGSATNSNGQKVDSTAPSAPPAVRDGTGTDISTTGSTTQLSANWDPSTDNESGISGYQYAIGTSVGGTQTVNWTSLGNVTTVTKTGLTLTNGQTYYVGVRAIDGAGLTGSATNSNGQTVQTTDVTPPSAPPAVRDGTGADISTTSSTTQLSANWDASTDNESGISGYQYAIGTSAGGTQTVNWTSLGNVTTVTKTGLTLTVGQTYFFSVKGVNGAGLTGSATNSNGQTVVTGGSVTYFQDNFESWTAHGGAWSSVSGETSTHTLDTSTDYAKAGAKGLKVTDTDTTATSGACLVKNFSPTISTDIYVRFFVYLPTGYGSANSGCTRRLLRVWCQSNRGQLSLTGTQTRMEEVGAWGAVLGSSLSESAWHCIEMHIAPPSASTLLEFWVDGVSQGTLNANFSASSTFTYIEFGDVSLGSGNNGTGTLYLDEIVVANSYVGTGITSPVTYFSDTFDSWAVHGGAWSSVNGENGNHTLNTSTDYARGGTKSLKLTDSDTTATTGAYLTKTFSPAISGDVYARFYVYLPTGYESANASCNRRVLRIWSGSNKAHLVLRSGTVLVEETVGWTNVLGPTVSENQWHAVEVHVTAPATVTVLEFWVDGTYSNALSANFIAGSAWSPVDFGDTSTGSGSNGTGTFYLDEIVVSNSYNGLLP